MHNYRHATLPFILASTVAAGLLCSCGSSKEEEPQPSPSLSYPMTFQATAGQAAQSRASETALEDVHQTFGVWAYKTNSEGGTEAVLMHSDGNAYETRYESPEWHYDVMTQNERIQQYIRYWDLSAKDYWFTAYAPYYVNGADAHDSNKYNISLTPDRLGVNIHHVQGNLLTTDDSAVDWVVATHQRIAGTTVLDYDIYANPSKTGDPHSTHTTLTDVVSPIFHHILSKVEFKLYNSGETPASVSSITLTLTDALKTEGNFTGASFTLSSPEAESTSFPIVLSLPTSFNATDKDGATSLCETLQLPQELADKKLNVSITITDGETTTTLTDTFDFDETIKLWEGEKYYIYTLSFSFTKGSSEIILMTVTAESWTQGELLETDTQTNW
ncbi:MAG: fimbrillin family protein [Bacteroidales bacterium]|nr:fimbrillin family protein [Bacteroidales bacterium]